MRHALLALPGVKKSELKQAMSHPQAIPSPRPRPSTSSPSSHPPPLSPILPRPARSHPSSSPSSSPSPLPPALLIPQLFVPCTHLHTPPPPLTLQALAQTDGYLRNSKIKPVPAYDTAGKTEMEGEVEEEGGRWWRRKVGGCKEVLGGRGRGSEAAPRSVEAGEREDERGGVRGGSGVA